MTVGPVTVAAVSYELAFTHTPTNVFVKCVIDETDTGATEGQKDAVFQAFLDKVKTLPNVTINYAQKHSRGVATVAPTP